jgi:hypothetical protein
MRVRPVFPIGRSGLLVLAAAAVPLVLSKCKPAAKWVGEKMVEWGEQLRKEGEAPETAADSSKVDMKKSDETILRSASPATKEEIKEDIAAKASKKAAPPKPKVAAKKQTSTKAGTQTNPKKTSTQSKK